MDPNAYIRELNIQFSYLFGLTMKINEIDTAAALFGEFRGMQDAGWSTTATAYEVFDELKALGSKGHPLSQAELRQVLCLYAHLAEAGGVYEGLLNTLQVAQLKPYNLWPFRDLVRVRKTPKAIIGPNSNAMFRHMAETAAAIGMVKLSQLLELAFRDDIRNGIAHADYILSPQALRLRRRNGGQAVVVDFQALKEAIQIAMFFFEMLQAFQKSVAGLFRPGRTVIGRFSDNAPMPWHIELTGDGRFSISSSSPGAQPDAAYLRQAAINDRLGGKMAVAYYAAAKPLAEILKQEVETLGFEIATVCFDTSEQFADALTQMDELSLWAVDASRDQVGTLMATPVGFRWVACLDDFRSLLPVVEEIEILDPPRTTAQASSAAE